MDLREQLAFFNDIDDGTYALLQAELQPQISQKGEMLLVPGQVQRHLYFVKSGVQMSYREVDGGKQVVAFMQAPGLCAIPGSFIAQRPSAFHLACLTDSEFLCLSFPAFQALCRQSPALEKVLRTRADAIGPHMISRHIDLRAMSPEDRYTAFCTQHPNLLQTVRHKHIASYLHIDPIDFTRLYHKLKMETQETP